jgi:hypothetical protein
MSRLIDKFHQAAQVASPPMGFRVARLAATPPKALLVASLEVGKTENTVDSLEYADAVLLHSETTLAARPLQKIAAAFKDIPWGLYLEADGAERTTATEAGVDFFVFPADGQVFETSKDDKAGKILRVESSMDDGLLRAVNFLPVDAIIVDNASGENAPLVWHQLMIYRHLSLLFSRPMIVPVPADISEKDLKALWDAGMDGILVEIDAEKAPQLKELKRKLDGLPARVDRKREKMEPRLPRTATGEVRPAAPDEEEEPDE